MDDKYIYFLPVKDKPVKLMFENNTKTEVSYYLPDLKIVLQEFLRNLWLKQQISTQQYKSERGKTKHYMEEEVVNFLVKKGISRKQIIDEWNTERELITIKKSFSPQNLKNVKFGSVVL